MTARFEPPRLVADVGGTFVRFALLVEPGRFDAVHSLRCADHRTFLDATQAYLRQTGCGPVRHAAVAMANPVADDAVRMTNYHWHFSIEAVRRELALDTLLVVNDFTALAMALPHLAAGDRRQVGGGTARPNSVAGVLGSGSGLGMSALIPAEQGWISLGSEGGHISFSPRDERELAILQYAWQQHAHVSFERLLSGPGLELIHAALTDRVGLRPAPLRAPEITRLALASEDARCVEAVDAFCAMLGTAAGNLAVTLGAIGGVYVGGSIVPRLGTLFDRSRFRARFEDHGRHSAYLAGIPTYVITAEDATFIGVASILEAQLAKRPRSSPSAILEQVSRSLNDLSAAERRVAEHVLAHPRSVLSKPIAEIAKAASVSQPTVIRFCRSLGCDGLSDFKLRLASAVSGTLPLAHTQVTRNDSALELGAKVLSNTASAILQVRAHLNQEAIDRAIELLLGATRVEFHAVGHAVVAAQDAQLKMLRLGISTVAHTDARVQRLAARVLGAGDVAVIISGSGEDDELLDVADVARDRGAAVLAITAGSSPLARRADVALQVDTSEDPHAQMPMISRILHLLVIDILVVGIAIRRSGTAAAVDAGAALDADQVNAPEATRPKPLTGLTTHSR